MGTPKTTTPRLSPSTPHACSNSPYDSQRDCIAPLSPLFPQCPHRNQLSNRATHFNMPCCSCSCSSTIKPPPLLSSHMSFSLLPARNCSNPALQVQLQPPQGIQACKSFLPPLLPAHQKHPRSCSSCSLPFSVSSR